MEEEGITYFVPGLPGHVSDNDFGRAFEKYGHVLRAQVINEKGSGGKCFGYVTMANVDSRDTICTDVHQFGDIQVRALLTKESLHAPDVKKIHIGKLATHITADAIREVFSQFGAVLDVHTPKRPQTGERMNYGFVTFGSDESFDAAIEAGTVTVEDCTVEIKPSAQSKGEEVMRKGKGKGKDKGFDHRGGGGHEDPDAGITRDRKGGFKYFVPGLPDGVVDEDLREHFSKYGAVIDAAVVTEKGTNASRGFGYVTMRDAESRDDLLNDKHELGGKEITVLLTKDSLSGSVKKVHLGNLREDISAEAIREVFSRFGQILDVHTPKSQRDGKRQNFGFVTFGNDEAFRAALREGTAVVDDCRIKIKPAAQTQEGGGGKGGGDPGMGMHPHDPYGRDPYARDPYGGKGMDKGYAPYGDPYGPPPGKGFDKGYGGKGWGPDPYADPYGKGYGGDPYGKGYGGKGFGGDPYGDPYGKGYAPDPYGGYKGGYGPDPWGGKGGKDPWGGMGGKDPWADGCGKGGYGKDPWGGKDPYGGKDPWGGKGRGGGDPYGKGCGDPYGKGGGGYGHEDPYGKGGGGGDAYRTRGGTERHPDYDRPHDRVDRGRGDMSAGRGGPPPRDYGRGDRGHDAPRSSKGGARTNPYDRYGK